MGVCVKPAKRCVKRGWRNRHVGRSPCFARVRDQFMEAERTSVGPLPETVGGGGFRRKVQIIPRLEAFTATGPMKPRAQVVHAEWGRFFDEWHLAAQQGFFSET